jgi:hypothetical protein
MPKKEINYQSTIIYKIVCNDLNVKDIYVGHTTDFTKRKAQHKINCNNADTKHYSIKVYQIIRDNEGWNNWSMIEIEKYPCHDNNEARARERYWYELLNANMNTYCPTLNVEKRMELKKVYYEQNKENILDHQKIYNELNKDKLKEQQKEYYELNKDKRIAYRKDYYESNKIDVLAKQRYYNKTHPEETSQRNKKKYESNKEAILAKQKLYRDAHKEHINRKCFCDICGREHLCRNKPEHIKSQFHLKALNNSNQ